MSPARTRPVLGAGQYAWCVLGFLALALYGSLVPFHFRPLMFEEAITRFREIPYFRLGIESRADWVANILLFLPLGFLATAALGVDRGRATGLLAAALVVPSCMAISVAIEFTQIFFPPRTVSQNDVVAESLGGLIGATTWLAWGQPLTAWARRLWDATGALGLAARVLPAYLTFLVLVQVMPLDLTISPVELYHKYSAGRVHLVPFAGGWSDPGRAAVKLAWTLAYYAPVGILLAHLPGRAWRDRRSWARILMLGLALAVALESLQLFVYTRVADITDAIVGGLAVVAGWSLARTPRLSRALADRLAVPGTRAWLVLAWAVVLALVAWWPLNFDPEVARAAHRLQRISWLPFADYYWGTEYAAFDQCLHKALLFLPLGVLLARKRLGAGDASPMLAGLGLATTLEAGQAFLPGRYPSVSDVVVEALGACSGAALINSVRQVLRGCRSNPSEGS